MTVMAAPASRCSAAVTSASATSNRSRRTTVARRYPRDRSASTSDVISSDFPAPGGPTTRTTLGMSVPGFVPG